jgi:predicted DNA-binding transcriptional regulator AlpA
MPSDPFPNSVLLTPKQVMTMLGMDRTSFYDFTTANPAFPRQVVVGKTKKGGEVKRYRKSQVMAFLELLSSE